MTLLLSVMLGLASMVTYAFANAFSKPLSRKLGPAQTLYLRGFTICFILLICSLPSIGTMSHGWAGLGAFLLGMAGYLPVLAFTHGIKQSPLGIIAPIAGTSPFITLLLSAAFLGLQLRPLQWVAIFVIIAANIAISVNAKSWRQSGFLHRASGIPYALAACFGWGIFYFALVPLTKRLGPWVSALLVEVGVTTAAGLHIWRASLPVSHSALRQKQVMLNGLFICLGTLAFTIGVRYYNIGIVAALSNSTSLATVLLGIWLFHEKLRFKDRIIGAIMIGSIAVLTLF